MITCKNARKSSIGKNFQSDDLTILIVLVNKKITSTRKTAKTLKESFNYFIVGKDDAESSDLDFANGNKYVGQHPTTAWNGNIKSNFYSFKVC